jgi:hypothetical protein
MRFFYSFFILIFFMATGTAQVLVNQEWATESGSPDVSNFPTDDWDKVDWSKSVLDSNGDLITVGNTLQSSGNADFPTEQPVKTAYSLHLNDTNLSSSEEVNKVTDLLVIAPNPNSGQFRLSYQLAESTPISLAVLNITGQLVYTTGLSPNKDGELELDLSDVPAGIYWCQLVTDQGVISQKWIKQ